MVVRYPHRVAERHLPQPRPPHAEDGALAPADAARDR